MRDEFADRSFPSWRRSLAAALALAAAPVGCGAGDVGPENHGGAIQGELVVRVADYEDKTTSTHYYLNAHSGEQYELVGWPGADWVAQLACPRQLVQRLQRVRGFESGARAQLGALALSVV